MTVIFTEETPHTRPGKTFKPGVEYVLDNAYARKFIEEGVAREAVSVDNLLKEATKKKIKK